MKSFTLTLLSAVLMSGSALAVQTETPSVVTGGVGEGEQLRIEQMQNQYNTKLVFTGKGGFYLADVQVNIRDQKGREIVSGTSDGPILLTELQPGRYTVEAEAEGHSRKSNITVGENLKTYYIQFPITDGMTMSSNTKPNDPRHFTAGVYDE